MAQFQLNWFAAPVMVNPNSTGQRALYRQKAIGGSWISTGFTPSNDLTIVTQQVTSPILTENKIWEFKIQCLCASGGPIDNNNGIIEALKFACIGSTLSFTTTTATIQLNISGLDITKATFTLKKQSDNSVVYGPVTQTPSGSVIQTMATGLTDNTGYYWSYYLASTVNGVEIHSTDVNQLNNPCTSANFTTLPATCDPITAITAVAHEY